MISLINCLRSDFNPWFQTLVSRRNKHRLLFIVNTITILCFLFLCFTANTQASELPDIGDTAGTILSIEEEKQLGKEFMRSIRQQLTLIDDPVSNDYIQTIGYRLASQIDAGQQEFHFFIVDDPAINAFAGPGGYIGIHTGLIRATESESELASVIAHEISHVIQRHLVRRFDNNNTLSVATMAALIAAVILGRGDANITEAVIASSVAGSIQQQLSFSRAHEQEADRVGIEMLASAGYNPNSMAHFFEVLQRENRFNETGAPEFILTHPVTAGRIADAKSRAMQISHNHSNLGSSLNFKLFLARLFDLSGQDPSKKNQPGNASNILPFKNDYPSRYKNTLRLIRENEINSARTEIKGLIKDDRPRIAYLITQAELEIIDTNIKQAVDVLANALMLYPNNQTLSFVYASTLLKAGKPKNAMTVLQSFIRNKEANDPEMYKTYAEAARKADYFSESFEALSNYQYQLGHTHTAIQHLEQAIRQKDTDTYQKLRLEARVEELKQEMVKNQTLKDK